MSTDTSKKKSNMGWIIAGVIIVIVIIVVGVVAYMQLGPSSSPSPSPSSSPSSSGTPSGSAQALTVYAGTVGGSGSTFGFGTSQSSISSPGPTLTFKVGQTYTVTLNNVGNTLHSWEISSTKAVGTPMWGAGIAVDSFLAAGSSGSVTFTPTQAGNYFYVCTVPGHIQLGMWGNVVVNP